MAGCISVEACASSHVAVRWIFVYEVQNCECKRSVSGGGWAAGAFVLVTALIFVSAWLYCLIRGCCCCCMPVSPPYAHSHATAAIQVKTGSDCCCFGVGPRKKVLYVHHMRTGTADVEGNMTNVLSVNDKTHMAIVAREQGRVTLPCDTLQSTSDTRGSHMHSSTNRLPRPSEQRYNLLAAQEAAFRLRHTHSMASRVHPTASSALTTTRMLPRPVSSGRKGSGSRHQTPAGAAARGLEGSSHVAGLPDSCMLAIPPSARTGHLAEAMRLIASADSHSRSATNGPLELSGNADVDPGVDSDVDSDVDPDVDPDGSNTCQPCVWQREPRVDHTSLPEDEETCSW
eukprot:jgi/Ulvmu1/3500/UM162_0007.1